MEIVGIAGSPHENGMTAKLMQRALDGAQATGANVTLLRLAHEELKPCRGCGGKCWDTQSCACDPAATARAAELQKADGLIIAAPVYCWQLNGLTALFMDKMRWNTRSVIQPHNPRVAFGMACAGGSGTGCVLALQALYRYFYNWAFHGIDPLPVTRFNLTEALEQAEVSGRRLVQVIQNGVQPFASLGEAILDYERLPYMYYQPLDELALIVEQQCRGLATVDQDAEVRQLFTEAEKGRAALTQRDRAAAAYHLNLAYHAGAAAWRRLKA
jgi:NAD(P)H-dependent FMN reductase